MTSSPAYPSALADHPLWQHPWLHMVAAGWATVDDFAWFMPLLYSAEQVREDTCARLCARGTPEHAALLQQNQSAASFLPELTRWTISPSEAPLPTFALYFALQYQIQTQADFTDGYAHLLALNHCASQIRHALHRAWQKKHPHHAPEAAPEYHPTLPNLPIGEAALANALGLLQRWLDDLYQGLRQQRVAGLIDKIQAKRSLQDAPGLAMTLASGLGMRAERDDKRNQEFSVARLPCEAQTLDPRIVRIAPGKYNNLHKHAHETLFCLLQGEGEILIGEQWLPFQAGDAVFAPRWAMHQTHNTGSGELIMYAITDYYLSHTAFIGAASTTVL
jgi:mannose-6-phosphate isomerase-like protein (cupin superfamily)